MIRPDHYGGEADPYEPRKVIRAWKLGFNLGNVLKYIRRADAKGDPIENLQKAATFLQFEIDDRIAAREALPAWVTKKTRDELQAAVHNALDALHAYDKERGAVPPTDVTVSKH